MGGVPGAERRFWRRSAFFAIALLRLLMMREDEIRADSSFRLRDRREPGKPPGYTKREIKKIALYFLPHARMRFEMIRQIPTECN